MTLEVVVVPGVEGSTLQEFCLFPDLRGMVDSQSIFDLLELGISDRSYCLIHLPRYLRHLPVSHKLASLAPAEEPEPRDTHKSLGAWRRSRGPT